MNKTTKYSLLTVGLATIIIISCKKDKSPPVVPTVTTAALTNVTTTSATSGGTITGNGGATITASGIVLSKKNTTPTITDTVMNATATTGSYTVNLTNLDFGTTYYIRAYATNSAGTGYGDVVTLNTTNDTTKVRFTYGGNTVTYGILVSATTGRKWLDRNLGASRVATAYDDTAAFGDYLQWGRLADGHQKKNSDTLRAFSSSDVPGHNKFIIASTFTDWRNPYNNSLWQGSTGVNNPCPSGWHVPTSAEWTAEAAAITDFNSAYNQLKLTMTGYRDGNPGNGMFYSVGTSCYYWTSTFFNVSTNTPTDINSYYYRIVAPPRAPTALFSRIAGMPIRCIKD